MGGSGIAAVIVVILLGGSFGFFLPGYMLVFAIQDGNYRAMTVFIIWISIATLIVVKIIRLRKDPAKEES